MPRSALPSADPVPAAGGQDAPPGRTRSGRAFVIGVVVVLLTWIGVVLVAGPLLRQATFGVDQVTPRRLVLATGELGGRAYEAVATSTENGDCVEAVFPPRRPRGICARVGVDPVLHGARAVATPDPARWALLLVAGTQVAEVRVLHPEGAPTALSTAGQEEGFPVAFAAALLPTDREVRGLQAVGADGTVLAEVPCRPGGSADPLGEDACGLGTPGRS